ncbi:translation initiation factor eIF 4e-like domain-containing protein [Boletus edulis BED1]|uniref:Translation initiation factor eIF 4e-like domain-containing protein n=1 Tax=Boletus edulis BED1 TaxID=1328754 RepID=A0AAD4C5I5_BOLED|nr:translation initiation factor eIF 4e-like domain-containing protein [Boletus edulis BED1]
MSEDTILAGYPYTWSPSATLSIEEFVTKYKPSMVQNDGTKPWIWARRERDSKTPSVENEAAAIAEGVTFLQQITARIEEIKDDASIPVRGNKKAGTKSKKEVREQVHTEAADKLKDISRKYGYVCGKWLIFVPSDKVDAIWSTIASSLATGPLSSTSAFCAKVATSPEDAVPGHRHLICVYIPDVYDKEDVTAVMKVLLRQHGLNLSGVKSDLYTTIGLDSKHPSGIPSTVWKNVSLLKDSEIKELKEAYYTELSVSKATKTPAANPSKESKSDVGKSKPLVKKKVAEDPFASDDDTDSKSGKLASVGGKRKNQESETGGSSNESPVKKKK